jgi:hypothetical protein
MDVVDAFEKNNIQNSSKIVALQNSSNIQWSELVKKDRVKDIKNLIKEMGRA